MWTEGTKAARVESMEACMKIGPISQQKACWSQQTNVEKTCCGHPDLRTFYRRRRPRSTRAAPMTTWSCAEWRDSYSSLLFVAQIGLQQADDNPQKPPAIKMEKLLSSWRKLEYFLSNRRLSLSTVWPTIKLKTPLVFGTTLLFLQLQRAERLILFHRHSVDKNIFQTFVYKLSYQCKHTNLVCPLISV